MTNQNVVIVTGASSGIGAATAKRFARDGYRVVLNSRSSEDLKAIASEIGSESTLVCTGDVSQPEDVETLIQTTVEKFGQINALVSNAGVATFGNTQEMSIEEWEKVMAVDARDPSLKIRAALPHLEKAKGAVVNVSSVSGIGGDWRGFVYNAAKGALSNMTPFRFICSLVVAGGLLASSPASASVTGPWQPASPEEESQILDFILNSPLGIAALNQLAIEGFISPLCDQTFYVSAEFGSFQSLLQVECPTPRGVNIARGYDEMRVTFSRFEDAITNFTVERIFEDEAGLPSAIADAVLQAAVRQSGADITDLSIVEFEPQTWSDGCLGLGGPAEGCLAALTEGWRVAIAEGPRTWVFRTNSDASQIRLEPQ